MPHYYPKKLRIGNVVLNEQDFKNLKNIDLIIQTHYEIPTKNLTKPKYFAPTIPKDDRNKTTKGNPNF